MPTTTDVCCFTSISLTYLCRARVLARSIRRFHPTWHIVVALTDRAPPAFDLDLEKEPFDEVLWSEDLPVENVRAWLFKHDLVEACTAVKGPVLMDLLQRDFEAVIYLDPDICLFNPMDRVVELLRQHALVLTPHQTSPEESEIGIWDHEIGSLKFGCYNLGFLAVARSAEGLRFAEWWRKRLLAFCYDETDRGIFVDQRWCDLVPCFFDTTKILRDPGYNVASWNISGRRLKFEADGGLSINGEPLRFWHFSKIGSAGDAMISRYAGSNFEIYELWNWYRRELAQNAVPDLPDGWWYFGRYADGETIPRAARLLYRRRADLQHHFPEPYASGAGSYQEWTTRRDLGGELRGNAPA